jgi:GNAT superfamily N-acetyltransferase
MSYVISICENVNDLENYYSLIDEASKNNLVFNFSEGKYYKVLFDNKLIGFASVVDEDYSFVDLKRYIHPEHRNKGVGEALLEFIIQDAKTLNKTRLTGSFLGDNENVVNFFISKGFKVTTGKTFSMVILSLK